MASIVFMNGERKGDYFPLGRRTVVVGRAESLLLQVLDDQVSRKHLQIRFDADSETHYAADMNSKNGVIVNERKISAETALADGYIIRIGDTEFLYTDQDFEDAESALNHVKRVGERMRPTYTGEHFST